MRRIVVFGVALAAVAALAASAAADSAYHTEQLDLVGVAGAPGGGRVVNIHTNGPVLYAHEIYKLKKAAPNAGYRVHTLFYPFDTDCSAPPTDFGFTRLETNGVGNGSADRVITPGDVPTEIRGAMHGVRWEVTRGGTLRYETDCNAVTLD